MRFEEVKNLIHSLLTTHSNGMPWAEIRDQLDLPYKTLCPEWTKQLETEIGLSRSKGTGRAFVWSVPLGREL